MDELRWNEGSCPDCGVLPSQPHINDCDVEQGSTGTILPVTCECPRPGSTISLLENKHIDLQLRSNSGRFELRCLDQPRIGETLVIGYYPDGWPWFGCFSVPTEQDIEEVYLLLHEGWEVAVMSEAWEKILDQQGPHVRESMVLRRTESFDEAKVYVAEGLGQVVAGLDDLRQQVSRADCFDDFVLG